MRHTHHVLYKMHICLVPLGLWNLLQYLKDTGAAYTDTRVHVLLSSDILWPEFSGYMQGSNPVHPCHTGTASVLSEATRAQEQEGMTSSQGPTALLPPAAQPSR